MTNSNTSTEAVASGQPAPLTAREKEILLFEQKVWRYQGAKETAVRERWDMSMFRYYQVLNGIIDSQAALAWDPFTVNRLKDIRARRLRVKPR